MGGVGAQGCGGDSVGTGSQASCESVLRASADALFAANAIPRGKDMQLASAVDPTVRAQVRRCGLRTLALMHALAKRYATPSSPLMPSSHESDSPAEDSDDGHGGDDSDDDTPPAPPEVAYEAVVEALEAVLDQANTTLDEVAGIQDAVVPTGLAAFSVSGGKRPSGRPSRQCVALDIPKPQLQFPDYPIDNSDAVFLPHPNVTGKHDKRADDVEAHLRTLVRNNTTREAQKRLSSSHAMAHPCDPEITAAVARMTDLCAQEDFNPESKCTLFGPLDPPALGVVDTEEELFEVAQILHGASEIAVDLEHHSVRSFQGFICLIQISTRKEDFVIDAIALRGSVRRALSPVFADGAIVKVMHGANHDVQWLERDFGIHVVNLFDTGRAAKLLSYPSLSLAFLLQRFADVDVAQKRVFQTADWRQRPLAQPMIEYARSDTHYLLYIYDRLVCDLHKKKLLPKAWEQSASISRKRYMKDRYDPEQPVRLAAKYGLCYDPRQMRVLKELCKWRDATAREEDESIPYVLPNRVMFAIVRCSSKARNTESLLKEVLKECKVPPLVQCNAEKLAHLVADALDAKVPEAVPSATTRGLPVATSEPILGQASAKMTTRESSRKNASVAEANEASKAESSAGGGIVDRATLRVGKVNHTVRKSSHSALFSDSDNEDDSVELDDDDGAMPSKVSADIRASDGNATQIQGMALGTSNGNLRLAEESKETAESPCAAGDDSRKDASRLQGDVRGPSLKASSALIPRGDSDSEAEWTTSTGVDAVMASFVNAAPRAPVQFAADALPPAASGALNETDGETAKKRAIEKLPGKAPSGSGSGDEESEACVVSLRELYTSSAASRVRKKRSRTEANAGHPQPDSRKADADSSKSSPPPFDYAAVRSARKNGESGNATKEVYNPLGSFLRQDANSSRRVKRARKNPKSGEKSMTFRPQDARKSRQRRVM